MEGRTGKVTQGVHYKSMRWVSILAGAVFLKGLWLIPIPVRGYMLHESAAIRKRMGWVN